MLDVVSTSLDVRLNWRCKKVQTAQVEAEQVVADAHRTFSIRRFEQSAIIMGVPPVDFWSMSMYQFQSVRAAYCIQHGFREDGSDPDKLGTNELKDLFDKVAKIKEKRDGVQN